MFSLAKPVVPGFMLIAALSLVIQIDRVYSDESIIITATAMKPYLEEDKTKQSAKGLAAEIAWGALKRAGVLDNVKVEWYPWKRVQKMVQSDANRLSLSMTRTKAREDKYEWIAQILMFSCYAFAIDPKVQINDVDALANKSIGSLAGSPPEQVVLKMFPKLKKVMKPVTSEEINAKKLLVGRLDAWITQDGIAHYYIQNAAKQMGLPKPKLIKGKKFFAQPIWVVVGKKTSPELVSKLKAGFANYKKSKEYSDLLEKWGVEG